MIIRVFFVVMCLALLGAFSYMSHKGVWRESFDLDTSVRVGGHGGGFFGRIK